MDVCLYDRCSDPFEHVRCLVALQAWLLEAEAALKAQLNVQLMQIVKSRVLCLKLIELDRVLVLIKGVRVGDITEGENNFRAVVLLGIVLVYDIDHLQLGRFFGLRAAAHLYVSAI